MICVMNVVSFSFSTLCTQLPGQILFPNAVFPNSRFPPTRPPKPPVSAPPHSTRAMPPIPPQREESGNLSRGLSALNGRAEASVHPPLPSLSIIPSTKDKYEMVPIKEEALLLGQELGQGEFGSVLRGKYRLPNGKSVSTVMK